MVFLVGGKFLSMLRKLIESALGTLSPSAVNCGLGINSNKTDFVMLSRKYKIKSFRLSWLDDRELTLSSDVVFLDVVLDWQRNTEERKKRRLNVLHQSRNYIGKS